MYIYQDIYHVVGVEHIQREPCWCTKVVSMDDIGCCEFVREYSWDKFIIKSM